MSRFLVFGTMTSRDLFPRDSKYGHAANFNLQPVCMIFTLFLGQILTPYRVSFKRTAHVDIPPRRWCANFSKPTPKKPSLSKHDEIVTLFHELGHGIHDLVLKTIYSRFYGTITVVDFGEATSQMLENWCWTPSQLKSLSRHYSSLSSEYFKSWEEQADGKSKPPEQIPDEMIGSLIRAK